MFVPFSIPDPLPLSALTTAVIERRMLIYKAATAVSEADFDYYEQAAQNLGSVLRGFGTFGEQLLATCVTRTGRPFGIDFTN